MGCVRSHHYSTQKKSSKRGLQDRRENTKYLAKTCWIQNDPQVTLDSGWRANMCLFLLSPHSHSAHCTQPTGEGSFIMVFTEDPESKQALGFTEALRKSAKLWGPKKTFPNKLTMWKKGFQNAGCNFWSVTTSSKWLVSPSVWAIQSNNTPLPNRWNQGAVCCCNLDLISWISWSWHTMTFSTMHAVIQAPHLASFNII